MIASSVPVLRRWKLPSATTAWWLSTCAFVLLGACLAYGSVMEVDRLTSLRAPTPPEVSQDVIVRNAKDQVGHRASFRVLLFSDEFRWKLSSIDALEDRLEEPEFTPQMKAVLGRAREIIVVGASSEEIAPGLSYAEGRKKEERRAARRAGQIELWVRRALNRPIPIRKLNVGHHVPTAGASDTSDQRRVVIILVLEREDGTNVDEALREAMAREIGKAPIFDTLLTRYSLSSGQTFTWVD